MFELTKDIDAGDEGLISAGTLVVEHNRFDGGLVVETLEGIGPFMVGHDEVCPA